MTKQYDNKHSPADAVIARQASPLDTEFVAAEVSYPTDLH